MEKGLPEDKVLLLFLPFWTPYIPPQGVAVIKKYLKEEGIESKILDLNVDKELRVYYNEYFLFLKELIPYEKRGNFFNIGHDVLLNHMMAFVCKENEQEHLELVEEIVFKTYYQDINKEQCLKLESIIIELYKKLEAKLINVVQGYKPSYVGATAYSGTLASCIFAFNLIKSINPNITTVVGGGSFSDHLFKDSPNFIEFTEKVECVDKIIIGDGRKILAKIIKKELPKDQKVFDASEIDSARLPITCSGDIPDTSDLDLNSYLYTASTGSRSCPYKCSFCNVKKFWGEHVLKDTKQYIEEIKYLSGTDKTQLFFMYDALLNNHITELSETLIKGDFCIYFVGYLKVSEESCDINNTFLWRRGGFYRARLGTESGSQNVLDLMDKKITVDQIRATIKNLAIAGIKTTTYWVIGHPHETERDFQATLDIVEELKDYIWEAECNPFNYYYSGQQNENDWSKYREPLYTSPAAEKLMAKSWTLNIDPLREETYRRMNRFVQHCDKLKIPNPYTINEIYEADKRWKDLQPNAVPTTVELKDKSNYLTECRYIKQKEYASKQFVDISDFEL